MVRGWRVSFSGLGTLGTELAVTQRSSENVGVYCLKEKGALISQHFHGLIWGLFHVILPWTVIFNFDVSVYSFALF